MAISTIPAPLAGKVAIVTGGSRGIGAGIAAEFVSKGVSKIAITYTSNPSAAEDSLAELRKINPSVTAIAIQADLEAPDFATSLVSKVLEGLSTDKIDILVGNAALASFSVTEPVLSATKAVFDRLFSANAWAQLALFTAALPHIPRGGRVIFISSVASKQANQDPVVLYGASKAALDSIVRSLARQLAAPHGITINSVSVGATRTDALKDGIASGDIPDEWLQRLKDAPSAAKRLGEVEDIAGIVGFLASDEARWINGNNVAANGGMSLELQG